ncbi:hypothetical protein SAMN02949497_0701 [Methylomagnum ishizawai]|uniref:Uncharacterized protein n=1 Tax=Methylomagnum ishizawai TaxID=1760988 RepID=A0A1Y6CT92_9GAMM|nr:hypothetical protein [Methylomagnum ishizawai]SMF93420.1 hypothetical protein SAMN02949497_0701 [Methylomagnum ishizawai]
MDLNSLLAGKQARIVAGGLAAAVGYVMMYPDLLGIPLENATLLPGVPFDLFGGIVFALGIFLIAKAMQAD